MNTNTPEESKKPKKKVRRNVLDYTYEIAIIVFAVVIIITSITNAYNIRWASAQMNKISVEDAKQVEELEKKIEKDKKNQKKYHVYKVMLSINVTDWDTRNTVMIFRGKENKKSASNGRVFNNVDVYYIGLDDVEDLPEDSDYVKNDVAKEIKSSSNITITEQDSIVMFSDDLSCSYVYMELLK